MCFKDPVVHVRVNQHALKSVSLHNVAVGHCMGDEEEEGSVLLLLLHTFSQWNSLWCSLCSGLHLTCIIICVAEGHAVRCFKEGVTD